MIKTLLTPTLLFIIAIFFLNSSPVIAQGDLMVMPKRIVFDGSQRSQEISLANTGSDTAVYAISFINYKMTESGSFEQVEEPEEGQRFAEEYLRYFPRRVVLAPKEGQTVRVQITRSNNLEQGEYRSHIYFRAVEDEGALGENQTMEGEGIAINIKTVFGISIPVIIKQGTSTTNITLSEIDLDKNAETPKLSLVINRSGNMSVYGNLKVNHVAPNGTTTEIGIVKGISVYTPNAKRYFTMELRKAGDVDLTNGTLQISYSEEKGQNLATHTYKL